MNSCKWAIVYLDVMRRLGLLHVTYIAWYRFTLKSGIRKWRFPQCSFAADTQTPFFEPCDPCSGYPDEFKITLLEAADQILQGNLRYYAYHWKKIGNPPNWFLNPFNKKVCHDTLKHWTAIDDFNTDIGDIKNIWEASRFEWSVTLARAYVVSGKKIYLDVLNKWLNDWADKNPINSGPNWKCGQEASIRIFNLVHTALILKQVEQPNPALKEFIYRHLERISANILYAISQDNNHGTSEAAALFIGGYWGRKNSSSNDIHNRYDRFARQGRRWLENRVKKLVKEDGSFSQHSITYHRVLLDTLSFVEYWRRKLGVDPFSEIFYQRSESAINWLCQMTDSGSGNAPNLGANDGSALLNLHNCDYRDFRPSIQTASLVFNKGKVFNKGPWDEPNYWLDLSRDPIDATDNKKISEVISGGYAIMVGRDSWGMLRIPMYRFRPGHNDVFHFDLWYKGKNICRDAGSFSYNPEKGSDREYFKSVKAHNTVCFDDDEQMPQLGHFMLGKWIKAEHVGLIDQDDEGSHQWTGAYRDYRGNRHQRKISWRESEWAIEDTLSGGFRKAEIMYHLIPDSYRIEDNLIFGAWGRIEIPKADCDVTISDGIESLYYWQKQPVKKLILHIGNNGKKIMTRFLLGK
jgi:hypothetical protein